MALTSFRTGRPFTTPTLRLLWIWLALSSLLLSAHTCAADPQSLENLDAYVFIDNDASVQEPSRSSQESEYLVEFQHFDRGIIGRADLPLPTGLTSNAKNNLGLKPGDAAYYSFAVSSLTSLPTATAQPRREIKLRELRKRNTVEGESESDESKDQEDFTELVARQDSNTIYISFNTCQNPGFTDPNDQSDPPQLDLYVSQINQNPGPGDQNLPVTNGFAAGVIQTDVLFIGVHAPNISVSEQENAWNFDIAVSNETYYHDVKYDTSMSLSLVDSDPHAALLVTTNLTGWAQEQASDIPTNTTLATGAPFGIFISQLDQPPLRGLQNSYCALQKFANASLYNSSSPTPPPAQSEMGITHNMPGGNPEQQIYITSLKNSSTYSGTLSQIPAGHVYGDDISQGGGVLYAPMNFTTKRDENCAVIYNLTFCSQVNYAVPANPYNPNYANTQDLAALYDSSAAAYWKNFNYTLMLTPCNTTATAQYSLVAGCDNCTAAYKAWLCAVTIPRCADWALPGASSDNGTLGGSIDSSFLFPRNTAQSPIPNSSIPPVTNDTQLDWLATNSSRNSDIVTTKVQAGPYMEILPCEDLCYDLVRMCPASMKFSCPQPGSFLMSANYGKRGTAAGGSGTCSAPGVLYFQNGANGLDMHWWVALVGLSVSAFVELVL